MRGREGERVRMRGREGDGEEDLRVRALQIMKVSLRWYATRVDGVDRTGQGSGGLGSAHYSAVWLQVKSEY